MSSRYQPLNFALREAYIYIIYIFLYLYTHTERYSFKLPSENSSPAASPNQICFPNLFLSSRSTGDLSSRFLCPEDSSVWMPQWELMAGFPLVLASAMMDFFSFCASSFTWKYTYLYFFALGKKFDAIG